MFVVRRKPCGLGGLCVRRAVQREGAGLHFAIIAAELLIQDVPPIPVHRSYGSAIQG